MSPDQMVVLVAAEPAERRDKQVATGTLHL
jgi:hypothetical protein